MALLSGEIEVRGIEAETGAIAWTHTQTNLIPEQTLISLLNWNFPALFATANISISTQSTAPQPTDTQLTGIIGTGYVPTGVTSPAYYDGVTPVFCEVRNRIDQIGIARTFDAIGLTNAGSANSQDEIDATAYAMLLLDLPCTQQSTQFLDLRYKIQFNQSSGINLSARAIKDMCQQTFGLINSSFLSALYASLCGTPTSAYTELNYNNCQLIAAVYGSPTGWTAGTLVDTLRKWKYTLNQTDNPGFDFAVGTIFNLMLQGQASSGNCAYSFSQFSKASTSPVGNLSCQVNTSNTPFFDPNNYGTSTGKITVVESSTGSWNGKFPDFIQILIGTSGATGTATYKFRIRKWLGFSGNAFTDVVAGCPFRNDQAQPAPLHHGWKLENNDVLRFSNTQIVQYDDAGVTLLDILSGNYITWDATTSPALSVTRASTSRCRH